MKKKWILVLLLSVVLCVTCCVLRPMKVEAAEIASGTCGDNLTWVLTDDGVLRISGQGSIPDYNPSDVDFAETHPWISIKKDITEVIIEDGVTRIGKCAFYSHSKITKVTIPNSVTSMGKSAFEGCRSLVSVTIPDSITYIGEAWFHGCKNLVSVTIPDSVTSIGKSAFSNCEKLSSIIIPDSVTSIGELAFANCMYLNSINIPASVASIGEGAFRDCYLGQVHIKDLASWCKIAFEDAQSNPLHRGINLYLNGEPVTELVIPDGTTDIGQYAFLGCKSITNVIIPDGVTSIGDCAFQGNVNMTQVTIPGSVTRIGADAFWGCKNLSKAYLSDLVAWCGIELESQASNPLSMAGRIFVNGEMVTDLIIPDGATRIGKYTFAQVNYLLSVTIPEGVTIIDDYAFYYSRNLSNVIMPNSVTNIGASAFADCTGLLDITIPAGVSSVGKDAFFGCDLREVHIKDLAAWCKIDFEGGHSTPMNSCDKLFLNGVLLTDLVIPDGITSIGQYAFYSCGSLESVTIPDGVTSIGLRAFAWCENIESVSIPNGVTIIDQYAFEGCGNLAEIKIPNTVTSIGVSAFQACKRLVSVTLPDSVTTIGDRAFSECESLSKVVLSNGLKTIPGWMFYNCTNLAVVIIPHSVNTIQSGAFAGCRNLWHVLYTGTKWQWSNVFITQYADDSTTNLKSATMHYNYDGSKKVDAFYKASTCSAEGEKWMRCDLCGAKHSEVIPKLNYSHYGGIWTSIDEKHHKWDCPYCDEEGTEAHSWWHGTITKVATCVADGEIRSICSLCDMTKTEPVAAKGHSYQKITTAPTCTEQGYTTYTCFECGDSYVDDYVAATGHLYGEWTQVKKPTTEEAGLEERVCSCGDKEQNELPMLEPAPTEPRPTEPQPSETKPTTPATKHSTQPTDPKPDIHGTTGDSGETSRDNGGKTVTIAVVAALVVLGGGAAVLIVLKKKK